MGGGGGRRLAGKVSRRRGDRTARRLYQGARRRMGRTAHRHRSKSAGGAVGHVRLFRENYGKRSGHKCGGELFVRTVHHGKFRGVLRAGDMDDQRIILRTPFGGVISFGSFRSCKRYRRARTPSPSGTPRAAGADYPACPRKGFPVVSRACFIIYRFHFSLRIPIHSALRSAARPHGTFSARIREHRRQGNTPATCLCRAEPFMPHVQFPLSAVRGVGGCERVNHLAYVSV